MTACLEFSIEMESLAWRVITTALIILLVMLFFVNLVFMVLGIANGELLIVRENW